MSAAFAAQSANSFPWIPTWPGIHIIFVLFCMSIKACCILLTISELVWTLRASMIERQSYYIFSFIIFYQFTSWQHSLTFCFIDSTNICEYPTGNCSSIFFYNRKRRDILFFEPSVKIKLQLFNDSTISAYNDWYMDVQVVSFL